jgi:hypothetical protein
MNKGIQTYDEKLQRAIAVIKEAILQGQYEACKGVNRIQLAVYFGIGKYISQHTRKGVWGTGALDIISDQLRRELPGLRGYSATQMKDMRLFYEAWSMLDANSSVATDELEKSTFAIAEIDSDNSPVATDELKMFYYRGLREWGHINGYLTDTCLTAQDHFKAALDYFRIKYE